ncbi:MAG: TetR/AcrR family transcriptional regulator [Ktedonobacteraceae bacterium]|nr:TetR/AcrR family transcriptional regulator [Ktedonobacteraceae bacterium]
MNKISQDGRRTRHEPRKQDLLAAAVEYVFEHGFSELSIRPLAAALGISHRTLLYHFHSKENLVVELLKEVRVRERLLFAFRFNDQETASLVEFVQTAWQRFTAPEYEGYFRLFFEVYGLALQEPTVYGGFLEGVVTDWLPLIEPALIRDGYPPERALSIATLILSSVRGLQLDLLATHDRKRAEAAFEELLTIFRSLRPIS